MITLYGSGPNFGLPDASPFVTKAETLLRMSKLPFEALMSFSKAPKGKNSLYRGRRPMLGDSTLIRWHLEKKYGVDFDLGLPPSNSREGVREGGRGRSVLGQRLLPLDVLRRQLPQGNVDFFKGVPAPVPTGRGVDPPPSAQDLAK